MDDQINPYVFIDLVYFVDENKAPEPMLYSNVKMAIDVADKIAKTHSDVHRVIVFPVDLSKLGNALYGAFAPAPLTDEEKQANSGLKVV